MRTRSSNGWSGSRSRARTDRAVRAYLSANLLLFSRNGIIDMADKKKPQPQPKSNAPMLIIGLVLVVGAVAGWYLLTRPRDPAAANSANRANANNTNANTAKSATIPP